MNGLHAARRKKKKKKKKVQRLSTAMVDRLFWRAGFGPSEADRKRWHNKPVTSLVDWFLHTPLSALDGPTFLGLFTLIIGLLAYIAYNYLNAQIDKTGNRMEVASAEFVDILQEPTR